MWKKAALFWLVGTVMGLYTTFVLQNLWNWFVTEAFHLSSISFWVMYGIVLIFGMFGEQHSEKSTEEQRIKVLMIGLDACIPEDKKELVKEQLEEQEQQVWGQVGMSIFEKVVTNTFTLGLGWTVHVLLT